MTSYYYLISSLPMLSSDEEMPLDYASFLELCQGNVPEETYQRLANLKLDSDDGPLLNEWGAFYKGLQKELACQRAQRLDRDCPPSFEKDPSTITAVAAALNATHPLEAERILLKYEFERLDLLVGMHMFDDHVLYGYAVKLKLLERITSFEKEKGKQEFSDILESLQKQVFNL